MLDLTPSTNRPELVRALMEGLAFWLRDNIEMFRSLGIGLFSDGGRKFGQGEKMPEITVIGGATQAIPLLQIKAAITGCRIKVPQIAEAAATGAALLAGIGANIFRSGEEAASSIQCTVQTYEPDTQTVEIYNCIYEQAYLPARRLLL
jgi:sugar (pentulose or hexulose) kinase